MFFFKMMKLGLIYSEVASESTEEKEYFCIFTSVLSNRPYFPLISQDTDNFQSLMIMQFILSTFYCE